MVICESGLLENGNPSSWHTHALRHSFETEASHAGVKAEVRNSFLGHLAGIQWTYNHRDEIHPEDLRREYLRIEPYVSLSETETTLEGEFEEERMSWIKEIQDLKRQVAHLAESTPQARLGVQGS